MSVSRKRASPCGEVASDDDYFDESTNGERATKRTKLSSSAGPKVNLDIRSSATLSRSSGKQSLPHEVQKDEEGNSFWALNGTGSRRVGVSTFKGTVMVGVREYYEKDGRWLPGKKGISLPVDQFSALINVLPQIEQLLAENGARVPRPNYDSMATDTSEAGDTEAVDAGLATKKKNHEATSDEDEE